MTTASGSTTRSAGCRCPPPGDRVQVCRACTFARVSALDAGFDDAGADAFVQFLRRETDPYNPQEENT